MSTSRRIALFALLPALSMFIPGIAAAEDDLDATSLRTIVEHACTLAGTAHLSAGGACSVTNFERHALTTDVFEYSVEVRVGPAPHDVIGLHRVVRERAPYRPVHTSKAVMMAHGDLWGFDAAFVPGNGVRSFPILLAENDVDVWGIDFRWTRVPGNTSDFSFMQGWGMETDMNDLGTALGVARGVRLLTMGDHGKLTLLGWSRGGQTGVAYLDAETQIPAARRHVSGFIPVDIYLKIDVASLKEAACARYAARQAQLEGLVYQDSTGALISTIGTLASADPNGSSFLGGGMSNETAGLVVGAATFALMQPYEPVPFYHMTAGSFDAGAPVGLLFTEDARLFQVEAAAAPYEPVKLIADAEASMCDDPEVADVPFDDHLDQITVPVFYVGAGGGFGEYGLYTQSLLGSADVSSHVVTTLTEEARLLEHGHADIWLGADAEGLFWQPMLEWIQSH